MPNQAPQDQTQAELQRILENYKEYVTGVYQGVQDYDEGVAIAAIEAFANQRALELLDEVEKTLADFDDADNLQVHLLKCQRTVNNLQKLIIEAKRLNLTKEKE